MNLLVSQLDNNSEKQSEKGNYGNQAELYHMRHCLNLIQMSHVPVRRTFRCQSACNRSKN